MLEDRSRELFQESVERLDLRLRSRLNQARHAALESAAVAGRRPWYLQVPTWTPAAGIAAAALVGVALWLGGPLGSHRAATDGPLSLDDLEIVASADEDDGTYAGDALEMLQNDLDFYDFAAKAANAGPAA